MVSKQKSDGPFKHGQAPVKQSFNGIMLESWRLLLTQIRVCNFQLHLVSPCKPWVGQHKQTSHHICIAWVKAETWGELGSWGGKKVCVCERWWWGLPGLQQSERLALWDKVGVTSVAMVMIMKLWKGIRRTWQTGSRPLSIEEGQGWSHTQVLQGMEQESSLMVQTGAGVLGVWAVDT